MINGTISYSTPSTWSEVATAIKHFQVYDAKALFTGFMTVTFIA